MCSEALTIFHASLCASTENGVEMNPVECLKAQLARATKEEHVPGMSTVCTGTEGRVARRGEGIGSTRAQSGDPQVDRRGGGQGRGTRSPVQGPPW